ncbi:hypothetical protein Aph01nite_36170 [Acrocarpospora phusangensis]|uniref:Bulb-type lectin domain-containing protein n=1 Tax=Acrocarpospora phusangensis TaxID=1070424 RepID=A0A919UP61_9ACTN|nr:hypothetical protein [Acrocarpospora phusangensis]GIH25307.1 hypothetical protein Aph01nite_36170 [Acrocarpospora phusangensis]
MTDLPGKGAWLSAGQYLTVGDYLVAANGQYFAIMQSDGNFVIYRGSGPSQQGAFVWNTGTARGQGQCYAIMQPDGNFVIYRGSDPSHKGAFVWNTGIARGQGQSFAILQDDGIFVVYQGSDPAHRKAFAWASHAMLVGGDARPLAELDPGGTPVVLSYDVPEPTSYRGRHIIELDIPPDYFVTQEQADATPQVAAASVPTQQDPMFGPDGSGSSQVYNQEAPVFGTSVPTGRATPDQLTVERITTAFNLAKSTGYFDPAVFPNVQAGDDKYTRSCVKEALADLDATTVVTQINAGNRFVIYRDTSGRCTYRFIPVPRTGAPALLLVEYYRLSSFPARYGAGRTIKTFSLLPGERTRIRVSTYKRTAETASRSSSVLDSTSDETESEFERSIQGEQTRRDNNSRAFEYHADVEAEAKASWGWGSASVTASGGVKGTSNAAREEFAKNVATAVSQNAARASSRRDVQIDTSLDVKLELGEEQAIERELENVNVSRTLNFVFRQMNQEFVTLLHLVDIRAAFFNGFVESRAEVPLPALAELLDTYILPEHRQAVLAAVTGELQSIVDHAGRVRTDFVESVTLTGADDGTMTYLRVNDKATSTYGNGVAGPVINLPGVILNADTHVMRTDGVVVDTFLGLGNGLDDYSRGLQEEEVRGRRLENDRRQAEVDRLRLAVSLVERGDTAGVDLYQRVFPPPQIVNQIEQAAVSGSPDGSAAAVPTP